MEVAPPGFLRKWLVMLSGLGAIVCVVVVGACQLSPSAVKSTCSQRQETAISNDKSKCSKWAADCPQLCGGRVSGGDDQGGPSDETRCYYVQHVDHCPFPGVLKHGTKHGKPALECCLEGLWSCTDYWYRANPPSTCSGLVFDMGETESFKCCVKIED